MREAERSMQAEVERRQALVAEKKRAVYALERVKREAHESAILTRRKVAESDRAHT